MIGTVWVGRMSTSAAHREETPNLPGQAATSCSSASRYAMATKLSKPCAADHGAGARLFVRYACHAAGNALWVCLACWAGSGATVNGGLKKKAKWTRCIQARHAMGSLCHVDFWSLHTAASGTERTTQEFAKVSFAHRPSVFSLYSPCPHVYPHPTPTHPLLCADRQASRDHRPAEGQWRASTCLAFRDLLILSPSYLAGRCGSRRTCPV